MCIKPSLFYSLRVHSGAHCRTSCGQQLLRRDADLPRGHCGALRGGVVDLPRRERVQTAGYHCGHGQCGQRGMAAGAQVSDSGAQGHVRVQCAGQE